MRNELQSDSGNHVSVPNNADIHHQQSKQSYHLKFLQTCHDNTSAVQVVVLHE